MIKNVKRIKKYKNYNALLKKKLKEIGKTFCSKLIIKLTSKIFIPDLYLQILKYEYNNRTNDDIAKTLPRFQKLESLNEYVKYKEDQKKNNSSKIIIELAWVSFYKYKKKLSFIKKADEDRNNFYLVLNGNISKLVLTFKKEKISIEEYLLYMIKMKLLQEKQILYKCNKLNKAYVNLDINNFRTFFSQNKNYNFKELKNRAKKELIEAGFTFDNNNKIIVPSLEKYLKLGFFQTVERNDTETRFHLFIGNYIKTNTLSKGDYIGDLSRNDNNEGCTYICDKNCDICYVNKNDSVKSKLYELMLQKYKRIFIDIKSKFYILKDTSDDICLNRFVPLMVYKKFKKGEKIIIQNMQYEGIYFIIDGEVKISISQTFNELSNTLISLQYSIFNFKDYVSKIIKTIDIIKEFNLIYMIKSQNKNMIDMEDTKINNDIFSSNEFISYFNDIKNIEFYTLKEGDIVGLNELFDYKSELYNFTAECISEEVNLFFLSKRNLNDIMEKESNIMNNIIQLIDLKAKSLIGKINNYRYEYRNVVINNLNNKINKTISFKKKKEEVNKDINNMKNKNDINNNNIVKNRLILSFNKKKDNKEKIINNIKLFKNNELLNYLKNTNLVRCNSISDKSTINNINKKLLTNRYIYQPKINFKMFSANSTTNNLRKTIKLKNVLFKPSFNKTSYTDFPNKNNENNIYNHKRNFLKNFSANVNMNLGNNESNKIIFNKTITPIGNGEQLLFDIINNQKKFDELQNENYSKKNLPLLNGNHKKKVINTKIVGKTDSFKNITKIYYK